MIKLYIFESVEEIRAFERPEPVVTIKHEVAIEPEPAERAAEPEVEEEIEAPRREPRIIQKPKVAKKQTAKKAPIRRTNAKYSEDELVDVIRQFDADEITAPQAAKRLGVITQAFYNARNRWKKRKNNGPVNDVADAPAQKFRCLACGSEEHNTKDCPDLPNEIARLHQKKNLDSLRIAQQLRIPLKLINEHWPKGTVQIEPEAALDEEEIETDEDEE